MSDKPDLMTRRAQDFWASMVLLLTSVFFIWKTIDIPFWGENRSGVSGTDWFTSAALVPFGIFGSLLCLSLALMAVSVHSGGARRALTAVGVGWHRKGVLRFITLAVVLASYVVGLVPRVDFILASALLITALVFGFHGGHAWRAQVSAVCIAVPAITALVLFLPQSQWGAQADDWIALIAWLVLTSVALATARHEAVVRALPLLSMLTPAILVSAMAFGFRQNVPARSGLVFKHLEYHYYVTVRPLWRP